MIKDSFGSGLSGLGLASIQKVILGRGIHPFRSRPKSLELLIPIDTHDKFCNKAGELSDGHMFSEAMVVDPVGAVLCIFNDFWIFMMIHTPPAAK